MNLIEKIHSFYGSIAESGDLSLLSEGVFDPHILKAVFMAGSGGSGKGFISDTLFGGTGLKVVNTDDAYEYLLTKSGLIKGGKGPQIVKTKHGVKATKDKSPDWRFDVQMDPEHLSQVLREPSKHIANARQSNYIDGRLGLILDSTATKPEKVIKLALMLNSLGYDLGMVFVNTALDTSIARNAQRRRALPDELLRQDWAAAQKALPKYRSLFGSNYIEINNNKDYGGTDPDTWKKELVPALQKAAAKLYSSPVENPIGKEWIKSELEKRSSKAVDIGRGKTLKPSSKASKEYQSFFDN